MRSVLADSLCGIPTASEPQRRCRKQMGSQICFFNAATGYAFTIVLAGFAFTLVSLPNITLTPAFVAGLVRVLIRQTPGTVKIPELLTSFVAMATKLLITSEHAFCFKPLSVARCFMMLPFDMALAPAFMDFFIGGNMVVDTTNSKRRM